MPTISSASWSITRARCSVAQAMRLCCVLLIVLWLPSSHAASALGYRFGTFGFGLDFDHQLKPDLTLRAGYNLYVYSRNADSNGVHYDAALKINAASLLLDWHRNHSPWRVTMGFTQTGPQAEANGSATGNVTFNGQTYSADQLGSLKVIIKPKQAISPYLGIGRGRAVADTDHFSFLFDLGVIYTGSPKGQVQANCNSTLIAAQCAQLLSDIQAEVAIQENKWRDLKWWPMLSVGFAMRW